MSVTDGIENEQTALWNGQAGHAWVAAQELLDEILRPFEDLLIEATAAGAGLRVLDVGCGTGGTTLAIAQRVGAAGRCVGVDISEPMTIAARARSRTEGVSVQFIHADAQTHAFEAASFDLIISRFGVMFFDSPVAAFANLRRAARPGAELRFIAWRGAAENPFMTTAEHAAAPLLPNLPPRDPGAPGQFAFADQSRVATILGESGWVEADIRPMSVECSFPEKELVGYFTRLGPLGRVLSDVDEKARTHIIDTVRAAFEPFVHGTEVQFTAACWLVSARSS